MKLCLSVLFCAHTSFTLCPAPLPPLLCILPFPCFPKLLPLKPTPSILSCNNWYPSLPTKLIVPKPLAKLGPTPLSATYVLKIEIKKVGWDFSEVSHAPTDPPHTFWCLISPHPHNLKTAALAKLN